MAVAEKQWECMMLGFASSVRYLPFFALLAAWVLLTPPSAAQTETLRQIIAEHHAKGQFDGVVLISQRGRVLCRAAFGDADRKHHFSNTPDTPYRLCSITKQFTALLIMQCVQSRQLYLSDTVSEYLPNVLPRTGGQITLKNLLTHTSGLPNLDDVPNFYGSTDPRLASPAYVIKTYLQGTLKTKPGEKFSYNNADYIVLQAILEKTTGRTYAALLNARVLKPLGMRHTGVIMENNFAPKQALGYVHDHGRTGLEPQYHLANFGAAGAMFSTANDMLKWNTALDNDRLLAKPYREIMFTADKSLGYVALGSWVYRMALPGGRKPLLVERQGEIGGFRTLNLRAPEEGIAIVVLSNTDTADLNATYMQQGLAYDLLRALYLSQK